MRIQTNIGQVTKAIAERLKILRDPEYLLRPVAFGLIDKMTQRIHIDGKGSDESEIGQYSNSYLKQRQKAPLNRTGGSNVIVSATRLLENDWSVIAVERGYGIGFKNPLNLQKARWVENGAASHTVKAHKRNVKTAEGIKSVEVQSYQNPGWAGHGKIFDLTEEEKKYTIDYLNELTAEALQ
jgi:hypothetical protein